MGEARAEMAMTLGADKKRSIAEINESNTIEQKIGAQQYESENEEREKKDTQWGRSYCSGAKVRVIIIIINSVTTTT